MLHSLLSMRHHYRVYGLTLASDAPLETPLHPAPPADSADLVWTRLEAPRLTLDDISALTPLIASEIHNAAGESAFRLYSLPDGTLLHHYNRVLDLYVTGDTVSYAVREPGYDYLAEIALLGPIAAQALGERGIVCLHASAVALPRGAAIFLAESKAGKSTLATSFLRAGGRFLSDDMAALTLTAAAVRVEPGYPQVRLWPDTAALIALNADEWPRVLAHQSKVRVPIAASGLGTSETVAQPVAAIYLPERDADATEVTITRLSRAHAFVGLTKHLMHAEMLRGTGTPLPLAALGEVVQRVPVYHLRYPSGFTRLSEIHAALMHEA